MAKKKPHGAGCGCLLAMIWMIGSSLGGWSLCSSKNDSGPSQTVVADVAATQAKPVSRFEAQETRAAARERVIAAELERSVLERVADAEQRLLYADDDDNLEAAVCHARWTLSRVPPEQASDPSVRLLAKAESKTARKALAVLRRAAMANRMLLCADGTSSPTCECDGDNRGCCSHHGGVIGCERAERPSVDCRVLSDREHAIEHATALGRFSATN